MTEPEINLQDRFPNLTPIHSAPSLGTLNGFGFGMYGKRDFDEATGTYIKTHCLCAVFIPIFTFSSYRVADAANGGWHFLGKEKKSSLARGWNRLVIAIIIYFVFTLSWSSYTNSPEYLAGKSLKAADEQLEEGQYQEAAELYRFHISKGLPHKNNAEEGLQVSCTQLLASDQSNEVIKAIHILSGLPAAQKRNIAACSDLAALSLSAAQRFQASDPKEAIQILNASTRLEQGQAEREALKFSLLQVLIAKNPKDSQVATELALIYEQNEQFEDAFSLLQNVEDALGDTEGARLYGQLLQHQGNFTKASPYLEQYVAPRLATWKKHEASVTRAYERSYDKVINDLNDNKGSQSFYRSYDAARTQEQKDALLNDYLAEQIQKNASYKKTLENYSSSSDIVPVVMDLGIAQLRAGQASTNQAEKARLLQKAEDTFLSLQGAAGETDEYRMFLGQVYYWSGKQAEGRQLFDQFLLSNQRSCTALMSLASILREVGNTTEALKLSTEAYDNTNDKEEKYNAASLRAVLSTDTEDELKWLKRTDPSDVAYNVRLDNTNADLAAEKGDTQAAIKYFRAASAGWSKMPESATSLNNNALVHQSLYLLTGDPQEQVIAAKMLDQALSYKPNDSILIGNTLSALLISSNLEVIDSGVPANLIQVLSVSDAIRLLYQNEDEYEEITKKIAQTDSWKRSLELLENWIILAPNNPTAYATGSMMYDLVQDEEGFKSLLERVKHAQLDNAQSKEELFAYWKGTSKQKYQNQLEVSIKRTSERANEITDPTLQPIASLAVELAKVSRVSFGQGVDFKAALAAAQNADKLKPCKYTKQALITVLINASLVELQQSNADINVYITKYKPFIGGEELLALLLDHPQFGPIAKSSRLVAATMSIYTSEQARFPRYYDAHKWSLIRHFVSQETADRIANQAKANTVSALQIELAKTITPYSTSQAINSYYQSILMGDSGSAMRSYERARSSGIPLPSLN